METLQRTANRGSISTGYDIDNSVKLEADNTEYLSQTIGAGSRTTATYSFWFKRTELGADMQLAGISPIGSETTRFLITSNDVLDVESGVGGDNNSLVTNRVFRDTSAWYHFVVAIDTTQATEANRVKVYVNGVQETSFSASEYPAQNTDLTIGVSGYTWRYGAYDNTYNKSSGYLAEAYYIDAQQLDPTSFGKFDEDTGIWKPIAYTGSFGSNGHYLDFSDASDLGNNSSGVGNDFTLNNITSADQATDTPTNNFATISVTAQYTDSARIINQSNITNGATKITKTDVGAWGGGVGTMGVKSGKWYYEGKIYDIDDLMLGFSTFSGNIGANASPHGIGTNIVYYGGGASGSYWFYHVDGTATDNASNRGTVWSVGDIIGIALDLDNSKANFYVNGSLAGSNNTNVDISDVTDEINSTGDFLVPFTGMWRSTIEFNFGGYTVTSISSAATDENGYGTFEYAPPSGYYALCTKNLAEYG